ncbi:MAG: (d)CMP kinase [Flavobacteriaceae bacterium]
MKKIIIAIDGYASTGKSTQAKKLAERFNYVYINTGAMYRAVTYYAVREQLDLPGLIAALPQLKIGFSEGTTQQRTFLNEEDISNQLHTMPVAERVSTIAALPEVRQFMLVEQRRMGSKKGVVMDGRDIGTVIFPEAECKFFLTASVEIRAQRRTEELRQLGNKTSYTEVLENLISRDQIDSTRTVAPLIKADDALLIDVSDVSLLTVYETMETHVLSILGQ